MPGLENNLLSISSLDKDGYTLIFEKGKCKVMKNCAQVGNGYLKDQLYVMNQSQMNEAINVVNNSGPHERCIHSLHRKLGHVNFGVLNKTKACVSDLKKYLDCNICKLTKSKAFPVSNKSKSISEKIFQLVHLVVVGPL